MSMPGCRVMGKRTVAAAPAPRVPDCFPERAVHYWELLVPGSWEGIIETIKYWSEYPGALFLHATYGYSMGQWWDEQDR